MPFLGDIGRAGHRVTKAVGKGIHDAVKAAGTAGQQGINIVKKAADQIVNEVDRGLKKSEKEVKRSARKVRKTAEKTGREARRFCVKNKGILTAIGTAIGATLGAEAGLSRELGAVFGAIGGSIEGLAHKSKAHHDKREALKKLDTEERKARNKINAAEQSRLMQLAREAAAIEIQRQRIEAAQINLADLAAERLEGLNAFEELLNEIIDCCEAERLEQLPALLNKLDENGLNFLGNLLLTVVQDPDVAIKVYEEVEKRRQKLGLAEEKAEVKEDNEERESDEKEMKDEKEFVFREEKPITFSSNPYSFNELKQQILTCCNADQRQMAHEVNRHLDKLPMLLNQLSEEGITALGSRPFTVCHPDDYIRIVQLYLRAIARMQEPDSIKAKMRTDFLNRTMQFFCSHACYLPNIEAQQRLDVISFILNQFSKDELSLLGNKPLRTGYATDSQWIKIVQLLMHAQQRIKLNCSIIMQRDGYLIQRITYWCRYRNLNEVPESVVLLTGDGLRKLDEELSKDHDANFRAKITPFLIQARNNLQPILFSKEGEIHSKFTNLPIAMVNRVAKPRVYEPNLSCVQSHLINWAHHYEPTRHLEDLPILLDQFNDDDLYASREYLFLILNSHVYNDFRRVAQMFAQCYDRVQKADIKATLIDGYNEIVIERIVSNCQICRAQNSERLLGEIPVLLGLLNEDGLQKLGNQPLTFCKPEYHTRIVELLEQRRKTGQLPIDQSHLVRRSSQVTIELSKNSVSSEIKRLDLGKAPQFVNSKSCGAQNTLADGNCAFHAVLGEWNQAEGYYACPNIRQQRKKVADAIRASKPGHELYGSIITAIQAIVMKIIEDIADNIPEARALGVHREEKHIPLIVKEYQKYLSNDEARCKAAWKKFENKLNANPNSVSDYIKEQKIEGDLHVQFHKCLEKNTALIEEKLDSIGLRTAYKEYNEESRLKFDWNKFITSDVIGEYAHFMEGFGNYLLPDEFDIIARVFDKTIIFFNTNLERGEIFQQETYNRGKTSVVGVLFNGVNHFEKVNISPASTDFLERTSLLENHAAAKRSSPIYSDLNDSADPKEEQVSEQAELKKISMNTM